MAVRRHLQKDMRLLGEPEDTANPDDVRHWRMVYAELLGGFRSLEAAEASTRRRGRQLQVEQLERRFAFWDGRYRELLEQRPTGARSPELDL